MVSPTLSPSSTDGPLAGAAVEVRAPARLHMGFIDPAGRSGRRFGSVGVAIDHPCTRVRVQRASSLAVDGEEAERARRYASRLLSHLGEPGGASVHVAEAMPAHAGLGSGTQLALALGAAISRCYGRRLRSAEVAALLERGGRSGIGVGAFDRGGFLVDGGKGEGSLPPPLVASCTLPEQWRVLLVFDPAHRGLSGASEREAFRALARQSPPRAESLAALVLLGMLPAAVEGDLRAFGSAVTELQECIGDHFSPVQGGRFASPAVTEVLAWLRRRGVQGVGQSSWGPTGFGFCEDETQARRLRETLEAQRPARSSLRFVIARPRNAPAAVEPIDAAARSAAQSDNENSGKR